jgi:acyl-CoA synthetase (NDP forming)
MDKQMPQNRPIALSEDLISDLNVLFNPKSIAVVGVPRGMKTGRLFLTALLDQGYPGQLYPVNPAAGEIDGLTAYSSVSDIPGPVELAIILVPHQQTLSVIRECAAKGVKGAVLFTAGYKETGTAEGIEMEKELVKIARSSGMRLIGPNCMGLYSPKAGLSFFPELSRSPGSVGIISHSGSLANILGRMGPDKGLHFSKAISLGNECDLTGTDFLVYLGADPDTRLIGTYLEGIKDGPAFLNALKSVSLKKPVILWKAGLTPEGSQAAASHTGALAGSWEIWEGVVHQGGGIAVIGFEAWVDTMMAFSYFPEQLGNRLAVISGPGGFAVAAAEACGMAGLTLARLSSATEAKLVALIAKTGTSFRNPIDIGLTGAMDGQTIFHAARAAATDQNVDAVLIVGTGMTSEENRTYARVFSEIGKSADKPIVPVAMPGFDQAHNNAFFDAGLPVFPSVERAMGAYARVLNYQRWRQSQVS